MLFYDFYTQVSDKVQWSPHTPNIICSSSRRGWPTAPDTAVLKHMYLQHIQKQTGASSCLLWNKMVLYCENRRNVQYMCWKPVCLRRIRLYVKFTMWDKRGALPTCPCGPYSCLLRLHGCSVCGPHTVTSCPTTLLSDPLCMSMCCTVYIYIYIQTWHKS